MDTWVGHQVRLEFSQVNIQCAVKPQGGSDRGHDLADQSVEIRVRGSLDVQVTSADVINGFVVNHESTV